MTNELIEGRYFNSSEDRFALIPSRSDGLPGQRL
jgi:hypothetical protein